MLETFQFFSFSFSMYLNRISRRNTTHLHHDIHRAVRSWVAAGWCWCALFFCYRVEIQRNPRFRVFLHVIVNTERSPGYDVIIILLGGAKRLKLQQMHPAELVWKQWHHHYDIITKHITMAANWLFIYMQSPHCLYTCNTTTNYANELQHMRVTTTRLILHDNTTDSDVWS